MMTAEIISTMVARIVGQFQPTSILLFGSQARGDAKESSDVDLLVVMREVPDKRQAAIEIRRSLRDLPVSKDIVVATPDEVARRRHVVGTIIHAALREGRVVYEQHRSGSTLGTPLAAVLRRGPQRSPATDKGDSACTSPCLLALPASRREGTKGGSGVRRDRFSTNPRLGRLTEHASGGLGCTGYAR